MTLKSRSAKQERRTDRTPGNAAGGARTIRRPDYIIVGGGSTGCTLAGRLTEDGDAHVTLIEQGPADRSPWIHFPVTYYKVCQGPLLSRYVYERSRAQAPAGVDSTMVQARVLGGGSSVNAMLYVRGVPDDYDGWAAEGAEGWSYAEVLPYFKRSEGNNRFHGGAHDSQGPVGVSDSPYVHPLTRVWLQACQQAGLPYNSDFNSGDQAGAGLYQATMRDGRRSSAAVAYLRPAIGRPNLDLRTNCQVRRILFDKQRAVGVEYLEGGRLHTLMAEREVICRPARSQPRICFWHRASAPRTISSSTACPLF